MQTYQFKLKCALIHLVVSGAVAICAALLIFQVWYPAPYAQLLAVGPIFFLAVVVDVVCGPLVTAVLANPSKSMRERVVDFGLVGILQLAALVYAFHAVYVVRPVAVVFEVDRFVVVSANEVLPDQLPQAQVVLSDLPKFSRVLLGTRGLRPGEDLFQSVEASMAGFGPAMRPSWWVSYSQVKGQVAQRARPVSELIAARSAQAGEINKSVRSTGLPIDQLRFLPFTSNRNKDWVVLLDDKQQLLAYAPVDGFIAAK